MFDAEKEKRNLRFPALPLSRCEVSMPRSIPPEPYPYVKPAGARIFYITYPYAAGFQT